MLAAGDAHHAARRGGGPLRVALYDDIQRLKLDVQTIAPFHGARTTTVAELARSAGKGSTAN